MWTESTCPRAFVPQQEKPLQRDTHASQLESSPRSPQIQQGLLRHRDPAQPEVNTQKVRTQKKRSVESKRKHANDSEHRCDVQDKMFLMVIRGAPVTPLLPVRCEDDLRSTGSQGLCIRLIPVNYKPLEVRSHTRLAGLHRASTRHSGWHILPLKKICWVNGCFSCRQQWLNRERWGFPDSSFGKESACSAEDSSLIPEWGRSAGEGIGHPLQYSWASLVAQLVKNPPAMRETWVRSLGWEDPLEKGKAYPLQNSVLENSMDCIMHRVAKSQTGLSNFHME